MSSFAHIVISEFPETCENRDLGGFSAALRFPASQQDCTYGGGQSAGPKASSKRSNPIHDLIF